MPHESRLTARWTRLVQKHGLMPEEQVRLRELGIKAKIERGDADAEALALGEVVRMRPARAAPDEQVRGRPRESPRIQTGTAAEREHAAALSQRIAVLANADARVQSYRA